MAIVSKTQDVRVVVRWRDDTEGYGDDIKFPMAEVNASHGDNLRGFIQSKRVWIEKEKADRIKKWKESHGQGGGNPNAGGGNPHV